MSSRAGDPDQSSLADRLQRVAGVLEVRDGHPGITDVTLRVVAGHGARVRDAATSIVPPGLVVHVLEDDLVDEDPQLPPPEGRAGAGAPAARARGSASAAGAGAPRTPAASGPGGEDGAAPDGAEVRCDYAFCRHLAAAAEPGDRCRQKIRGEDGWVACPGVYRAARPLRWWRRRG